MMDDKKVKTIVISMLIVLILVLAIVMSYAYFSTQLNGSDNIVKVGTLDLVLDETSKGLSIDNTIGVSDSEGMSLTPSTFKLINNGNIAVDYIIYLDDNTISDTDTRIDDKYLKYNLNKNGNDSGAKLLTSMGSNPNRILDSGTIDGKTTNEYILNLWITDKVDGNYGGHVFSGKLRVETKQAVDTSVSTVVMSNLGENGSTYDDGEDTFITGEDPNNYIWYSGKLWRAVSVNNEKKTTKLVTQWNISAINYSSGSTAFEGSYMEEWLNDTTVDGFLGNLRDYENFIVTDAKWNATMASTNLGSITRPNGTTTVTDAVGLLNMYEYQSSYHGTTYSNGYLNNGLYWWTMTPYNSSIWYIGYYHGSANSSSPTTNSYGIRPSINLKSDIKIVNGSGTIDDPYRLEGDNDTDLSGTLLNARYSGEYITFGTGENTLYRIVSHETSGLTKITSAEPLKSGGTFLQNSFYAISDFLNGTYLTDYVGSTYSDMISDSTTWYLGTVNLGENYRLAKYADSSMSNLTSSQTNAKVGLLRMGELMAGQFNNSNNTNYWTLTYCAQNGSSNICTVSIDGNSSTDSSSYLPLGIRPSMNLKSNVQITSGDGTLQNPFTLELAS